LLEFGHSVYLGNDGELKYAGKDKTFNTDPFNLLYKAPSMDVNPLRMSSLIQGEKSKWEGNYEGFFGRISKFNWRFDPSDGSYEITVKLIGMGDVISSLTMNTPYVKKTPEAITLEDLQAASELFKAKFNGKSETNTLISEALQNQLSFELWSIASSTKYPLKVNASNSDITLKDIPIGNKKYNTTITNGIIKVDNTSDSESLYNPTTYITFKILLILIQKLCNLKDNFDNHLINFSMVNKLANNELDNSYLVTYPGNFSSNPNKCLIKYSDFEGKISNRVSINPSTTLGKVLPSPPPITEINNPQLAYRLSDVWVNINFITDTLKSIKDSKDDQIPILDFLKTILQGINSSLGNLNEFRVIFNENTSEVEILSESPVLEKKHSPEDLSIINTFGLTKREGSFMTSMNLSAELTDDFASQITVAAQSNSLTDSKNYPSLTSYNKGLVDRMMVEKKASVSGGNEDKGTDKTFNQTQFSQLLPSSIKGKDPISEIFTKELVQVFNKVYNDREFTQEYIPTLESLVNNISGKVLSKYHQIGESPVPQFIPFNLSLEMEGIGGMKIYDSFKVQGRGLPLNYNPNDISLIVSSLSHTVTLDGWKTKVSTMVKPITPITITQDIKPKSTPIPYSPDYQFPISETQTPPSLNPTSQDRFEAMQKSYNGVFKRDGEVSGMCSRWTYNLATNYVEFLNNRSLKPGGQLNAGGNANNNNEYYLNLVKLGYSKSQSIVTKNRLIELIETTTWGYGDVIAYWCNDGPKDGSHVKYGHTQIYVGEINSSKWATSTPTNYNTNFPYRTRQGNNWTYIVFRAPEN
jgi:hypothetical protein